MGIKFKAPPLPAPPGEYSVEHQRQLIRVIELYFNQLDAAAPVLEVDARRYALLTG